jgi:transposase InsO family protein
VFHTDRGTQYASEQITTFAAENRITRSMGYTGICWDCETLDRHRAA